MIGAFYFFVSPIKIIIFPSIVNQWSRKPVREFGLSNENPGTTKSIAGRISLVKLSAAASIVLLLHTHTQNQS